MKKIILPFCLLLSACSDTSMEKDVLTAFERHSYEAHSSREVLDALRSGGPDGLKALDRHLELLRTEKPLKEMQGGGLSSGMLLEERDGALYIVKVFRGTPAEAAGLREGDRILEVDGLSVDAAAAARRIRAAVNFSVKAARYASGAPVEVTAEVRKNYFVLPLVFGVYDPYSKTAFIRAAIFSRGSGAAIAGGLETMTRMGAGKVVFDLRDTAGGSPDEAAALLAGFAPGAAAVFEIRSRHAGYCKLFNAPGRGGFARLKTAVLVNSRTSMAAEVFAAALKELNGAAVVGEATGGDVSLTRIFRAGKSGGLQLTIARMFPPSGAELEGKGLAPDLRLGVAPNEAEAARAEWSAAGETALLNDPAWRKAVAMLSE